MAKITQAQIKFLDKVIRTKSCACADIGELSARRACEKAGYLGHRAVPGKKWVMETYITDKAREAVEAVAHAAMSATGGAR